MWWAKHSSSERARLTAKVNLLIDTQCIQLRSVSGPGYKGFLSQFSDVGLFLFIFYEDGTYATNVRVVTFRDDDQGRQGGFDPEAEWVHQVLASFRVRKD